MKYQVTIYTDETYRHEYEVEADSKKEAEEKAKSRDYKPVRSKLVDSEDIGIETEAEDAS